LRVLFILVVLAHDRRRVVHFNVTERPTAGWTAQQIVEAFPDDTAPAYLLRDRDRIYGHAFRHRVKGIGIRDVLTAPQSPWQNPFAERLIGSIRRECLDHVLVLSERHLHRILTRYFAYYHRARTHLALQKDAPDGANRAAGGGHGRAWSSIRRCLRTRMSTSAGWHRPRLDEGQSSNRILCPAREMYGSARTVIDDPAGGFCCFPLLRAREAERRQRARRVVNAERAAFGVKARAQFPACEHHLMPFSGAGGPGR
jgi:Integrase core domain